jgi:hypothetical protein
MLILIPRTTEKDYDDLALEIATILYVQVQEFSVLPQDTEEEHEDHALETTTISRSEICS